MNEPTACRHSELIASAAVFRPGDTVEDMAPPYAARRDRLRALAADAELDAVLVTRLANVCYLTGFTGSNGALLVTAHDATLATDGRYRTQAEQQAPDVERVIERAVAATLAKRAVERGVGRLGFEAHDVTVELYAVLRGLVALEPANRLVEQLRAVKDEHEIALLRAACGAADAALADLLAGALTGRSERELARDLEASMHNYGAEGPSFDTIVASGPNSALPHHRPSGRVLAPGDLLTLDFGAVIAGYHSDMTRTVLLAPAAAWQREIYEVVAAAQQAGRDHLRSGVELSAVDAAARDVIVAAGYGEQYPHWLGHGVGLEVHEAPTLGPGVSGRLAPSMSVTVEPGVYLPGRGGVRIEDALVVRDGDPDLLTLSTKDLLVL